MHWLLIILGTFIGLALGLVLAFLQQTYILNLILPQNADRYNMYTGFDICAAFFMSNAKQDNILQLCYIKAFLRETASTPMKRFNSFSVNIRFLSILCAIT